MIVVVLAAVVGVTLSWPSAQQQIVRGPNTLEFDVRIVGMSFVPNTIEVPSGTHLVLNITNEDSQQHDLKLGSGHSGRINPGESVAAEFGVFEESTQGWCTIAGHKAMGMVFDVVVNGDGSE